MNPPGATLHARYAQEIAARGWQADDAQRAGIARLEQLRAALLATPVAPGLFGRLQRRLQPARATPAPGGIYLWGGVGRGKTWLMDMFHDSLAAIPRRRVHFHHFMRDVHAGLAELGRGQQQPLAMLAQRMARDARVWCLDEMQVNDIADAMILGGLYAALLDAGCTLVMTANVPPAGLYRDGLQRARFVPAVGLLERRLDVLQVDAGIDYRLRTLRQAPIYLPSDAPGTAAQLASLFTQLAGSHATDECALQLAGRTLQAQRRAGGVAWFGFGELCVGPRSASDYAELAADFHTVFVSDIPLLDGQHDDATRRFIALVDEFYDQGVKLVVSAAAAPAALYRGQRLAPEFRRTASRLVEMQSEEYLGREHLLSRRSP